MLPVLCARVWFDEVVRGGGGSHATPNKHEWACVRVAFCAGKFAVVARMLALLRAHTRDRIVIVSNYTQSLDLFAQVCVFASA
jgi:hypothetical protein